MKLLGTLLILLGMLSVVWGSAFLITICLQWILDPLDFDFTATMLRVGGTGTIILVLVPVGLHSIYRLLKLGISRGLL